MGKSERSTRELLEELEALRRSRDELQRRAAQQSAQLDEINRQLNAEAAARRAIEEDRARALSEAAEAARHAAEVHAALRESEERLRLTTDAAHIGTWEWDVRADTIQFSPECRALLGLAPGVKVGYRRYRALVHLDDRPRLDEAVSRCRRESRELDTEYRITHSNGEVRWIMVKGRGFTDGAARLLRMIGVSIDITSRKQAEESLRQRTAQLETANKDLEAFTYSVSHDLRSPLLVIDGFSRILVEDYADRFDEEGRRILHVIRSSTAKMGSLIDDLLSFSRLGRQKLQAEPVNMRRLAQEVWDELQPLTVNRNVEFRLGPLPRTHGDRLMLHQVFMNLFSNAIKFTATRARSVVEVTGCVQEREAVYSVRDNGVGFDARYAGKLFGVFQRLHREEEFPGTGVGLAIVKRALERHGGRIWAEGRVNEGATFSFTLPLPTGER